MQHREAECLTMVAKERTSCEIQRDSILEPREGKGGGGGRVSGRTVEDGLVVG